MRPVSVHTVTRCTLLASLLLCSVSLFFSRHGPSIVRSAQLVHRSNGYTQFCTRLDIRTNYDSGLFLSDLHSRRWLDSTDVPSSCSGVVVACMVSRRPILHICHAVVVLKQRLVSFQHVQFFLVGTCLILRSPSCTRSCTQKYRVSTCFVLGPAPNRSVKEFAVELTLRISTFIRTPRSMCTDLKNSPT